jgi:hypothetical protein
MDRGSELSPEKGSGAAGSGFSAATSGRDTYVLDCVDLVSSRVFSVKCRSLSSNIRFLERVFARGLTAICNPATLMKLVQMPVRCHGSQILFLGAIYNLQFTYNLKRSESTKMVGHYFSS